MENIWPNFLIWFSYMTNDSVLLFKILVILQGLDVYTTYLSITTGAGKEGNPAMAWLFDKLGLIPGLALAKILLLGMLWAVQYHPAGPYALGLVCCIYIAILLNNLAVLRGKR